MPRKVKSPFPAASPPQRGSLHLDEDDLMNQLAAKQGSLLWMGKYTVEAIRQSLEKSGIFPALRGKGLGPFSIRIAPLEDFDQALRVYCGSVQPEHQIGEARLRTIHFTPEPRQPESFSATAPKMLAIEWLLMQNPFAPFTADRPALPQQNHPGLGQSRRVLRLMIDYCRAHKLAGILNFPEFFHNAFLYRNHFKFYDPRREGILYALHRDLTSLPLADRSWAIELGCVRDRETQRIFDWTAAVQILPLHTIVRQYFTSDWYRKTMHHTLIAQHFEFDREKYTR